LALNSEPVAVSPGQSTQKDDHGALVGGAVISCRQQSNLISSLYPRHVAARWLAVEPEPARSHSSSVKDPRAIGSLDALQGAEASCTRCPLFRNATQVVPGEGPAGATLMMVGEQPGDQEGLAGRPFVGPAGRVLDRAIAEAGIDRNTVFVTNAVKHFKFEPRGKRRLHKGPVLVTIHPSYILRIEDEEAKQGEYERLVADLKFSVAALRVDAT
jgi:uracil-DNA glycosylase